MRKHCFNNYTFRDLMANTRPQIVGNKAKGRISKRVFQESKACQNCVSRVSGGKKYLFFRNFGVLCFLETPGLRFALLPYYRRNYNRFYI